VLRCIPAQEADTRTSEAASVPALVLDEGVPCNGSGGAIGRLDLRLAGTGSEGANAHTVSPARMIDTMATQLLALGSDQRFYALSQVDGRAVTTDLGEQWILDAPDLPQKLRRLRSA
jgi:hypothetical protein